MTAPVVSSFTVGQLAPVVTPEAPSAHLPATVAPTLPIVLRKNDVIQADTTELRSLVVARDAHAIFDRQTANYGDSVRLPFNRFVDTHGEKGFFTTVATFATSAVAAAGAAIATDGLAGSILFWGCGGSIAALVGGFAAALGIYSVEKAAAQNRPIPGKALEPLRQLYDATGTPLDRAIIARLAQRYSEDLDSRKARGEASRAVLRDLVKRGETFDADTQKSAIAIVDCFSAIHDDRGELMTRMESYQAHTLENVLATMSNEEFEKVCPMLLAVLYVDDVARPKMAYENESRLYRVLTGVQRPVYDSGKATKPKPAS